MKVYRGFSDYSVVKNAVVTIGTFDGVHIGHQTIINRMVGIARKFKGEAVLVTFDPHPRLVLQKDAKVKLLTSMDERINLLEKTGVDHLIIIPFDKVFSNLTSLDFIRDILVKKIGTKRLVIGYDHHFGKNREGSFDHLIKYGTIYGFDVEEIPPQEVNFINVSSTKIRNAVQAGDVVKASEYMGHSYTIDGIVVKGQQIGRSIGFPTANIKVEEVNKLIPKEGVYAVKVVFDNNFFSGMLNIGYRPTVGLDNQLSIEVHIFDFQKNIYGRQLTIEIIKHVRNEIQFTNVNDLRKQLEQDLTECKNILKSL
ncbi:MAG: riboflavin biosynthesis protein RibF [Flavobacteriales bacterium]|nr:riboflavin biosynthesis protein RibF [Flavobacteriales bacterium]